MTNLSNLVIGGAFISAILACWGQIKAVAWRVCSLLIQQVELADDDIIGKVVDHLVDKFPRSRLYDKSFRAFYTYINKRSTYGYVGVEFFGNRSLIFWNGWFPFFFHPPSKSGKANGEGKEKKGGMAYITFVRGTLDIDAVLQAAVAEANELTWKCDEKVKSFDKRFFVQYVPDIGKEKNSKDLVGSVNIWPYQGRHRLLGYGPQDIGRHKMNERSSLEDLVFPDRVVRLIEEIKVWIGSREWYREKNIPWKRGWLLYGPPGTGKTALARAFAEDLDLPIFVYDLAEMGNFNFMRSWLKMQQHTPCIALIEDIDNVFQGRENVSFGRRSGNIWNLFHEREHKADQPASPQESEEKKVVDSGGMLNFDVFLNCLDGVDRGEGVFTIITTNHVDKIDPALGRPEVDPCGRNDSVSSRPGRIDKAIELTYLEPHDKERMAQKILGDCPDAFAKIMQYVHEHPDGRETPAQFQERCSQVALAHFWEVEQRRKKACVVNTKTSRISQNPNPVLVPHV